MTSYFKEIPVSSRLPLQSNKLKSNRRSTSLSDLQAKKISAAKTSSDLRQSASLDAFQITYSCNQSATKEEEVPLKNKSKNNVCLNQNPAQSFSDLRALKLSTTPPNKNFRCELPRYPSLDTLVEQAHRRLAKAKRARLTTNTLDFKVCKLRILATLDCVEKVVSSPIVSENFKKVILDKFDELFTSYLFERMKFNKYAKIAQPAVGEIQENRITGDYAYLHF